MALYVICECDWERFCFVCVAGQLKKDKNGESTCSNCCTILWDGLIYSRSPQNILSTFLLVTPKVIIRFLYTNYISIRSCTEYCVVWSPAITTAVCLSEGPHLMLDKVALWVGDATWWCVDGATWWQCVVGMTAVVCGSLLVETYTLPLKRHLLNQCFTKTAIINTIIDPPSQGDHYFKPGLQTCTVAPPSQRNMIPDVTDYQVHSPNQVNRTLNVELAVLLPGERQSHTHTIPSMAGSTSTSESQNTTDPYLSARPGHRDCQAHLSCLSLTPGGSDAHELFSPGGNVTHGLPSLQQVMAYLFTHFTPQEPFSHAKDIILMKCFYICSIWVYMMVCMCHILMPHTLHTSTCCQLVLSITDRDAHCENNINSISNV